MTVFVTVLHIMVCLILVGVVLLQRGKGAEIGAVFGGGASSTVFGSRGAGNFLTKLTTGAAIIFMTTSLILSYLGTRGGSDLFDEEAAPAAEAPAAGEESTPFVELPAQPLAAEQPAAPVPAPEAPASP